jgi:hypothetical protein
MGVSNPDQLRKMAKYEKKRSARRSTPRHPITMASTAEPPDPMPCALAAILLPASRARGCSIQRGLFPGACWVRAGTCVFGPFMHVGCAGAAWMRGGSLDTSMGAGRRCLATGRIGGVAKKRTFFFQRDFTTNLSKKKYFTTSPA